MHKYFLGNMVATCFIYILTFPVYCCSVSCVRASQPCLNLTSNVDDFKMGFFVYFAEGIALCEIVVWLTARHFLRKMKFAKSVCYLMNEDIIAEGFINTEGYKQLVAD